MGRRANPVDLAEAARLYREGASLLKLGRHYCVSSTRLRAMLAGQGVAIRSLGRPHRAIAPAEAARLYAECGTLGAVAAALGCSVQTAAQRVRAGGGVVGPRGGALRPRAIDGAAALALWDEGLTHAEIGARCTPPVTRQRVQQIVAGELRRTGRTMPGNARSRYAPAFDADEAARLYTEGATSEELEARYGTTWPHIRREIIKRGVAIRPPGRRHTCDEPYVAAYRECGSFEAAGAALGCSGGVVRYHVRRVEPAMRRRLTREDAAEFRASRRAAGEAHA